MLDIYAFAPNAPPCLMRPPPIVKRGIVGWEEDVSMVESYLIIDPKAKKTFKSFCLFMCKEHSDILKYCTGIFTSF